MEATGVCSKQCQLSTGVATANTTCVAVNKLYHSLRSVFGFTEFRCGQLESMLPALHGNDTFVQMATGAGKSLCMFLVPLAYSDTAVGIIISPLNSLMDEQVTDIVPCPQTIVTSGNRGYLLAP